MVEFVQLNAKSSCGARVAVDTIACSGPCCETTETQLIKVGFGALNTFNIVTSICSNPFPVALSATDNAVLDTIDSVLDTVNAKLVTGTVIGDVNLGATDNAVLDSIVTNTTGLAGTVSGSELQVDIVASATLTVDLGANNDVTIDGSSLIQTFDAAADFITCGADTAIAIASVRDDALSALTPAAGDYVPLFSNACGALWTRDQVISGAVGAGTEAAAVRVTVATDSTGVLSVDDNAGSLTVDNTGLTELAAAINSSELDVNIKTSITQTVDLGANNDVTVDGSSLIQTFDAAADFITAGADTAIAIAVVRDDALSALTPAAGDYVPLFSTADGALWTALVDACGAQITCFGGSGAVQTFDAAADFITCGADSANAIAVVRDDALSALTPAEGDYVPLFSTADGALWTALVDACGAQITCFGGSGATQTYDAAADFISCGADSASALAVVRDDALSALTPAAGDYVPLFSNACGALWTRDQVISGAIGAGTEAAAIRVTVATDSTGVLTVDGTVSVNTHAVTIACGGVASGAIASGAIASGAIASGAIASGAIASGAIASGAVACGAFATGSIVAGAIAAGGTSFVKVEDDAFSAGDGGALAMGVRNDQLAALTSVDNDYAPLQLTEEGALFGHLSTTTDPGGVNGALIFRGIDIDQTECEVKGSGGNAYGYYFGNAAACDGVRFLKWYNAPAACVTVGGACATTPVMTMRLPANASGHVAFPVPVAFSAGITVAATTAVADADTGAPGANDVTLNVWYR